jgi:uncharacterized protein YjbK
MKEIVMIKNIEIEFKSAITEEKYLELLKQFDLENNIFKQINYYFDTDDYTFNQKQIVLRIRQKGDSRFKVTLKSQSDEGAYENHVFLQKDQALDMIENGFNTGDFFEDMNEFVTYKVNLENFRVSTPYEGGTLFLDRCDYCNVTDYEIEYEASHYDEGKKIFENFLKAHNIEIKPTKRKSERAFTCKR